MSTVSPTAVANGLPPKVLPWLPGPNADATSSVARVAPMGTPLARALASVMTSGATPGVLVAPEPPGAAHAGLDLVEDQADAGLVAELAQPGQVPVVGDVHAALALDGLDHDARGVAVDGALQRAEIVEGDVLEAARQRLEPVVVLLLRGGGDGGERPAVEAAPHRDDVAAIARPVLLGPLPRELDRRLVGLRARVGEEHAVGEGVLAEELGEVGLLGDVEEVRHVQQRGRLLADGPDHARVRVAQRGDGDAAR